MPTGDLVVFWLTFAIYGLAFLLFAYELTGRTKGPVRGLSLLVWLGVALHTVSLGLRWSYSGHMPGNNLFELNSVGGWCTVLLFQLLLLKYRNLRMIGVFVLGITLAMMLYGVSKPHALGPLSEEYQSPWFYIHIISAFLAYGCYVIATSAAILYLFRSFWERVSPLQVSLPPDALLEDLNVRFVAYGFGGHAIMLASGSVWANTAWGSYWSWDPVETWSLVTWLIYGFHLHARTFLGWDIRRLAWISIGALIAIVFTFWGVSHLPMETLEH